MSLVRDVNSVRWERYAFRDQLIRDVFAELGIGDEGVIVRIELQQNK